MNAPVRALTALLLSLLLAAGLASAQQYEFAVLLKTTSNPYWGALEQGIEAAAEEFDIDATIQSVATEQDTEAQLNTCLNMLQAEPDALLAAAINSVNLLPCLAQANEQGIPIVDLDGNLDPAVLEENDIFVEFTISSNNRAAGASAADYLVEQLGADATGPVLVIEGLAGNVTGQARVEGFSERLAELAPGLEIVASLPGDWDRLKAANITNDTLQSSPGLVGIYAANDTMALGAVETVYAAGQGDQVIVIGTDGNSDAVSSIEAGRLNASVAQLPYLLGLRGMEFATFELRGAELAPVQYVPTLVLDQAVLEAGQDVYPLLEYVK
jgi:ABC-type sugar transport system substrate-binding protein